MSILRKRAGQYLNYKTSLNLFKILFITLKIVFIIFTAVIKRSADFYILFFFRLENAHRDFDGSTDEETSLLEQVKRQHEVLEMERKVNHFNTL